MCASVGASWKWGSLELKLVLVTAIFETLLPPVTPRPAWQPVVVFCRAGPFAGACSSRGQLFQAECGVTEFFRNAQCGSFFLRRKWQQQQQPAGPAVQEVCQLFFSEPSGNGLCASLVNCRSGLWRMPVWPFLFGIACQSTPMRRSVVVALLLLRLVY